MLWKPRQRSTKRLPRKCPPPNETQSRARLGFHCCFRVRNCLFLLLGINHSFLSLPLLVSPLSPSPVSHGPPLHKHTSWHWTPTLSNTSRSNWLSLPQVAQLKWIPKRHILPSPVFELLTLYIKRARNTIATIHGQKKKLIQNERSFKWHFPALSCGGLMQSDIIVCTCLVAVVHKWFPAYEMTSGGSVLTHHRPSQSECCFFFNATQFGKNCQPISCLVTWTSLSPPFRVGPGSGPHTLMLSTCFSCT